MAAQRFGGKYSPDGQGGGQGSGQRSPATSGAMPPIPRAAPGSERPRGGWRATLLFLTAFAFLFPAFGDEPGAMLMDLIAGGLLILAAWLTREGMRARAAFAARKVARRPAVPRILFGAIATGAALFTGGLIGHGVSLYPVLFGLAGAALHIGAFGFDPWSDKGMEGIDRFQTDRVARALAGAEKTLSQMKDAILRAKDRQLEARVDRFIAQTRGLMQRVEEDPGDLTAARRYLTVYLEGARDATAKFADLWAIRPDPKARADYEALLTDLETTFATRSENLLGNDRDNLDIEISVLRDRLKFETPNSQR
ncbi:hypothetical protein HOY34_00365 [Xinfangfangia sp. D13-10-4-6]|uniref:5-bromo-4-chloroindolyl phosphate hydrolysis family protein n=1 Tax=Pseudogemmobacter hezensis TaxID=2737662 RepID=UPI001551A5ED|nr:5-bromo-4-chloroindolyl phosphate hydrolysis family protein [Pseudogemmobacter hezensis]NPD13652.1 hypothetical protein [Pseudogemmobacter hezensis]